jgi:hypothetical protein
LVATKVNVVADKVAVGVPEITQVVALTESVTGNNPALADPALIAHAVMADPFALKVVGVTDIAVPAVPEVPAAPV